MVYRILCIDGGGIRGVYALQVLKMLQDEIDTDLFKKIDCFAGTSTGSLIIASLNQGYQVQDLLNFYTFLGRRVFLKNKKTENGGAKYSNRFLKKMLKKFLPNNPTLFDIQPHMIIPSCHLSNGDNGLWESIIYDNYDRTKAKEYNLIEITLRSSAAPLYFPSYQKHIDGGVFALNPSLVALSRAIDEKGAGKELNDIRLLSIGNGINPAGINIDVDWGPKEWLEPYHKVAKHPLFSLLTEIGATIPEYPLTQILKNKTLRINGPLSVPIEIDDVGKIDLLKREAKALKIHNREKWESYKHWVRQNFIV